jgi:hypothetical protein
MALFQPGQPKTGGRAKGIRNRLSHTFLEALQKDFAEHGEEAIRICRIEKPNEYVKIVAGLMPRELDITNNTLTEIDDTQLVEFIEFVRVQLGERAGRLASRADAETDGGQAPVLLSIPKAT